MCVWGERKGWGGGGLLKRQNLIGSGKSYWSSILKYVAHGGKSMLYFLKEAKN